MGHDTLKQAQVNFLEQVDVGYSYRLAKAMEAYKSNEALGYRTAGSWAEFQTGEMLAQEMQNIGLLVVEKDEFTLDGWEFERARLTFTGRDGVQRSVELGGYQADFDTAGPHDFEIVYAGRGTAADFIRLDVRGKLALIDINQRGDWWINYPAYQAHLKGAAAVIAVQDEGYAQIDSTALNSQDICGPADAPAFSMSRADAALLREVLADGGNRAQVKFDAKSRVTPGCKAYNIVGRIPGRDPEAMIVMSAHYDSYFAGFQDDNAAVALMMGIAKALIDSEYRPEKTLVFCAMAAEEWGVSDTQYDWSTGAYNQVFRVHPDWVGRAVANINFELPAHEHDTQDVIRCVYELEPFLLEFSRSVPPVEGAYPDGVCVATPVLTWSDDFSMAIAGIPSLVNDFAEGGFMQTHYHSQFDNDEAYDEPAYRFHHNLYGMLMLALDRCAVPPLCFSGRLQALRESMDSRQMEAHEADANGLTLACDRALAASEEAYRAVCRINDRCLAALNCGDRTVADALLSQAKPLAALLLAAFRRAEDCFVRLTWHDEPIFPHQHAQNNLACLAGALNALAAGNLSRALDPFLAEVDNNWYALHFEDAVFRHFSDYVLLQPADRLMWGAGRVLGQEDLSGAMRSLAAKRMHPRADVRGETTLLREACLRQQALLAATVAQEIADVDALRGLLEQAALPRGEEQQKKRLLFISDFDGTITREDFYIQMLRLHPEMADAVVKGFRTRSESVFCLLSKVFLGMDLTHRDLEREIERIPIDPAFPAFARELHEAGVDLVILSAGCAYYIRRALHRLGLDWVNVYSNEGVFENRGLRMTADPASPFYSEDCGIDKAKVVQYFLERYETVSYAGDSYPDLAPSLLCSPRFAKGQLVGLLEQRGEAFLPFEDFSQVIPLLRGQGLL